MTEKNKYSFERLKVQAEIFGHINRLAWFQHNGFSQEVFQKIFGDGEYGMGNHLWDKFLVYDKQILVLWCYLDKDNRQKLVEYFNSSDFIKQYCDHGNGQIEADFAMSLY